MIAICLIIETRNSSESSNTTPIISCFPREPISPCSIFFPPHQHTPKSAFSPKLLDKTQQTTRPSVPSETYKFSFDAHMSQWAQDLRKPLATPSMNVQFDMPYCYSDGSYSTVSAKSFIKHPFGSIAEPTPELWSPQMNSWYEKAQMALQYYRYLCEQPSRTPLQTFLLKRIIPQLAPEQCALLGDGMYFEMFHNSGVRIGNIVFEEKNKSTLYLIPNEVSAIKPLDCSGIQVKNDSSIFTSSWQN